MTVEPSCPALLIHDDDAFRRSLITTLDEKLFSVTFATDGEEAIALLRDRGPEFKVVLLGLDLRSGRGRATADFLRDHQDVIGCAVIILGEATPELRTFAPWADETLMKPVDTAYVATRARVYCGRC